MKIEVDEIPFTPADCEYSSELYTTKDGLHYRCNFIKNLNKLERPLCNLKIGELNEISECRVFTGGK